MREKTTGVCDWCEKPFEYVRVTKRKQLCSWQCRKAIYAYREDKKLAAIRSGTLNPRPSLQKRSSIADCTGVLVPPSQIPANDFAWALEPPLPKQSWVFEVGGVTLNRLSEAEEEAKHTGFPIYCRPKDAAQKAAS